MKGFKHKLQHILNESFNVHMKTYNQKGAPFQMHNIYENWELTGQMATLDVRGISATGS